MNNFALLGAIFGIAGSFTLVFSALSSNDRAIRDLASTHWDYSAKVIEDQVMRRHDSVVGFSLLALSAFWGLMFLFGVSASDIFIIISLLATLFFLVVYFSLRRQLAAPIVIRIIQDKPSQPSAVFPVLAVVLAIIVIWYGFTIHLNTPWQRGVYARAGEDSVPLLQFLTDVFSQQRPVLPAPHQVAVEFWTSIFNQPIHTPRNLLFHAWITLSATGLGFVFGTVLGIVLAVLIVHNRAVDRSLMPWVIASQTIPILAIAPMIVVVLNSVGLQGLVPKALISTYLSFFPVVVGMVKGFRSPEAIQLDLMHTYNASRWQVFWKLRWPAAIPYLFTSMKVGVAASLVGAIVGELPTGAAGGLGARLLAGSYYGQTTQIWAALLMAAALSATLIFAIAAVQKLTQRAMGVPA